MKHNNHLWKKYARLGNDGAKTKRQQNAISRLFALVAVGIIISFNHEHKQHAGFYCMFSSKNNKWRNKSKACLKWCVLNGSAGSLGLLGPNHRKLHCVFKSCSGQQQRNIKIPYYWCSQKDEMIVCLMMVTAFIPNAAKYCSLFIS